MTYFELVEKYFNAMRIHSRLFRIFQVLKSGGIYHIAALKDYFHTLSLRGLKQEKT